MKPEERDAVIEECARVASTFSCGSCGMDGKIASAIRALTAQSPAGVPPEPTTREALQKVLDMICEREGDPVNGRWMLDVVGIARAALEGQKPAPVAGVPPTEPVAAEPSLARQAVAKQVKAEMQEVSVALKRHRQAPVEPVAQPDKNEQLERMRERLRKADQSPMHADALSSREPATDGTPSGGPMRPVGIRDGGTVEPVAQEPCADCKSPAACKSVGHCRHGYHARTVAQEPVAWIVRTASRHWLTEARPAAMNDGSTITPLYASPISLPVEVPRER
jgi:hypothetical protein